MPRLISFLSLLFFATTTHATIVQQTIDYQDGNINLRGTLVYDNTQTALRPGVVLFPEWWGHNDYIKRRAHELAEQGYVAFAADMYGDAQVTDNPEIAEKWATPFYQDRALMQRRANAAVGALRAQNTVDQNQIALIGFCMGGTVALEAARSGTVANGVVAFHAGLEFTTPPQADLTTKFLVLNGAADPLVPVVVKQKFLEEMQSAKADVQLIDYTGVLHAFTNPKADEYFAQGLTAVKYNPVAEARSMLAMRQFFREIFTAAPAVSQ